MEVNGFTEDHEMNRELRQLNLGNVEAAITVPRIFIAQVHFLVGNLM